MTCSSTIAAMVGLLGSVAAQAQSRGAMAAEGPTVAEQVAEGIYTVEGSFEVESNAATAWAVLKDYDHLSHFVSSIDESVVRRRVFGEVLLEQEGTGKALLLTQHFHLLLDVREPADGGIAFRDLSHRDFDLYEGSWSVAPGLHGLRVLYRLRAKPRKAVPGFIGKPAFDEGASQLLGDVRAEILRRTKADPEAAAASPNEARRP